MEKKTGHNGGGRLKDYDGGDVRLLACSTGKIDDKGSCIAQDLADHRWLKRRPERETAYGKDGRAVSVRPLRKAKEPAAEEKFIYEENEVERWFRVEKL